MPNCPNWMADTSPEAFRAMVEAQRRLSPGEKLALVFQFTAMLRNLAEQDVRRLYPQASEREVFLRTVARGLSRDLMIRAYGWDPESGEAP